MRIIIFLLIGAVLGIVSSKILFVGSFLTLTPWALVGLAAGIYSKDKNEAILIGALYGFIISFVFMVSGYSGSESLISRFPFFGVLGIVGAFCGMVLGFAGSLVKGFRKLND